MSETGTVPEGVADHRSQAPSTLNIAILTISDTRDASLDHSGALIQEMLVGAGHRVVEYAIERDEPGAIVTRVRDWAGQSRIDAIILTGGTGIAPRDQTPEALVAIFDRTLDGFGELFRMLSYAEVGSAAMLSRATAGIVLATPVFALPGSRNAVRLAMEKLVLPEIGHVVFEACK